MSQPTKKYPRPPELKPEYFSIWDWLARDALPGHEPALCRWCKRPARAYADPALTQCDGCWEFTNRLPWFLGHGTEARALVAQALARREMISDRSAVATGGTPGGPGEGSTKSSSPSAGPPGAVSSVPRKEHIPF